VEKPGFLLNFTNYRRHVAPPGKKTTTKLIGTLGLQY